MDMVRRARRLKGVGVKGILWRAGRRLLRCEVVLVMTVALDQAWRSGAATVPGRAGLSFEWLDERTLSVLRQPGLGYDDQAAFERSLARLDRGDQCVAGFLDGRPVTYLWLTHGTRPIVGDEVKLNQDQVWIYKTYTHPDRRRQGLTQLLGRHALAGCAARGDRVAFVDMLEVNRPSVAAFRRMGFHTLGRFTARIGPDGALQGVVPGRLLDRILALPDTARDTAPNAPPGAVSPPL
jgi:GNAT superfamily N-acetyltransferase